MAKRQMVHVGEDVEFQLVLVDALGRFVPPLGLADYCVATVGGERTETTPDVRGCFRFTLPFDRYAPGQRVRVTASAYLQRGGRDFMKIRGEWLESDSPYETRDKKVATDSITLTVYEAPIELIMPRPADELDPETGVMRIRRTDGSTTSVYVDKPGRPGFILAGPEPDGYYHVRYRPKARELNPTGTTEVTLTIHDVSGQRHEASVVVDTP
ncbi:MAG: hypothetical protein ACE5HE_06605 [Phycisphaerae bacterium]